MSPSSLVVAVWSGLALDGAFVPKSEIHKVVQYALDEIEFLTGDASTKWGAVRASLGHKKPWKVKWVEIGNEDWLAGRPAGFDSYKEYRFQAFLDAFTKKHPDIQIIASPSVFDNMTIPAPAAGDVHPYWTPDEFAGKGFGYFDQLTKNNLTLIGEAASVHPNGGSKWEGNLMPLPWWGGSVAEAIFLIGAERNGDRIIGACYAPGFRSLDRWQWAMTLMQHAADPALTTKSTSWHVWKVSRHSLTSTSYTYIHILISTNNTAPRKHSPHRDTPGHSHRRQLQPIVLGRRQGRRRTEYLQSGRI